MTESDVEAMLTACLPGGSHCDPQQVADSIRAWMAQHRGPTGGSPEHMLQDQDRGLSRWLASRPDARVHAREAAAAITDPLDMPLPCDIRIGHGTHGKGTPLRTLVTRMRLLYDMAQEAAAAKTRLVTEAYGMVWLNGALMLCEQHDREPCPHQPERRCEECPGRPRAQGAEGGGNG